jgi:probable biosynthetic protein (TIGR04098 family)
MNATARVALGSTSDALDRGSAVPVPGGPSTGGEVDGPGRRPAPPDSPRRIRVGMPQLDAGGLSENWLLRHAGDLQWEAIARRLGVSTDEIRGEGGERLYPTVVAVRGRYPASLAAVRENDVLDTSVEVVPAGRACAYGRIVTRFAGRDHRSADRDRDRHGEGEGDRGGATTTGEHLLALELLTTFAVREGVAGGLRMMPPGQALARRWSAPEGVPPAIARLARAARRLEPVDDAFAGPPLMRAASGGSPLGAVDYEPSPYGDYNGAGLLYFASYVTIADTAERQLVRRLGLADETGAADGPRGIDWALGTSAVRRDVYYYDNLPLGGSLTAALLGFEREAGAVATHMRISRAADGRRMADIITRRRQGAARPSR